PKRTWIFFYFVLSVSSGCITHQRFFAAPQASAIQLRVIRLVTPLPISVYGTSQIPTNRLNNTWTSTETPLLLRQPTMVIYMSSSCLVVAYPPLLPREK